MNNCITLRRLGRESTAQRTPVGLCPYKKKGLSVSTSTVGYSNMIQWWKNHCDQDSVDSVSRSETGDGSPKLTGLLHFSACLRALRAPAFGIFPRLLSSETQLGFPRPLSSHHSSACNQRLNVLNGLGVGLVVVIAPCYIRAAIRA